MKKLQVQGVHRATIVGSTTQSAVDFWQGVLGMPYLHDANDPEVELACYKFETPDNP